MGDFSISQDKAFRKSANRGTKITKVSPYVFVREADNGTGGFFYGDYLVPHTRERSFEERKNYSYYINFVKRILNALVDPVYFEAPKREFDQNDQLVDSFFKDCDKRGNSWAQFIRSNARKVRRYGCLFLVVDNDPVPAETEGIAIAMDQRPFVYAVSPERVTRIDLVQGQGITRLVFTEQGLDEKGSAITVYREITSSSWRVFKLGKKGEEVNIDSGVYTIGRIPVIPIYDELPEDEENPALPLPPVYHVAKVNLAIMNICSEMREQERGQMFSLLTIPAPNGTSVNSLMIGISNAIKYDPAGGGKPEFIGPDPAVLEAVMKDRDFLIEQLFEMAGVLGIVGIQKNEQSGIAKQIDFQTTSQNLKKFSETMEQSEIKTIEIFELFMGRKVGFEVEYSENFGLVDDAAEIVKTIDSLGIPGLGPKTKQAITQDWIKTRFRSWQPSEIKPLLDETTEAAMDEIHAENTPSGRDAINA